MPEWDRLRNEPGVFSTFYHTCMFDGSRRRKFQVLIHNLVELDGIGKLCHSHSRCERSRLPHEKWRPVIANGRVQQFVTGEEREYPRGFCQEYARLLRRTITSFLEVFSGPNAPLSNAVSSRFTGAAIPGGSVEKITTEAQSGDRLPAVSVAVPERAMRIETQVNRQIALSSGRQPSFGKRTQMIPDGLNCPIKHFQLALQLEHPFALLEALKPSHSAVLDDQADHSSLTQFRAAQLAKLRQLKSDPSVRQRDKELRKLCGHGARQIGPKMDLGLMEKVQDMLGLEDRAVPFAMCHRAAHHRQSTVFPLFRDARRRPESDIPGVPGHKQAASPGGPTADSLHGSPGRGRHGASPSSEKPEGDRERHNGTENVSRPGYHQIR